MNTLSIIFIVLVAVMLIVWLPLFILSVKKVLKQSKLNKHNYVNNTKTVL